ncbi:TPA: alanine racemase [Patescibacteria group bacterium]|uniref:Alanine racemase n=2 Tax=Bacteria division Kazan-3B-28 TaxID=1798534 RepID=A0A0G1X6H3_UNCK3|nr:MAG: alanine racemase, alanine racemase [candidate division Kazan bacterium GW2011_GWA1_50_15]KKW25447.1 MAG: Alanine racemase [candidate division Kazan bacterium GW2011_GWC1_52_13]KKW26753.1 MAG: Alanine racemase [candidate division Kazan bacterium GW2011_GWB1_52_7]HAV65749.1 alanine racemase [Patescibacteria group bacterium]HCL47760.1 alanine racemase [Patescibacteria group bacterium]
MSSPLYALTIDLKAIDHNIKQIKGLFKPGTKIIAVVKSNAYGHGLFEVARQALRSGASHLGVVSATEALELRRRGVLHPIVILGAVSKDDLPALIKNKVAVTIYNAESYRTLSRAVSILNKKVIVHLKLDTGINRLGFATVDEFVKVAKTITARPRYFEFEGVYSHLASVEELNQSYTNDQIRIFERALAKLADLKIKVPLVSLAASAAAVMLPESRFNCVRIGIEMYGLWPSRGVELWCKRSKKTRGFKLRPALVYKTRLVHVRRVKAGAYIGYGNAFQAPQAMTIGVIPVGYAEGLPRSLSNMGFALLKGAVVPIVGRVCMNMTILDVSRRPRAKVGDEVVLIGRSHTKEITATDVADWAGTINYEVVARLPAHIERIYK